MPSSMPALCVERRHPSKRVSCTNSSATLRMCCPSMTASRLSPSHLAVLSHGPRDAFANKQEQPRNRLLPCLTITPKSHYGTSRFTTPSHQQRLPQPSITEAWPRCRSCQCLVQAYIPTAYNPPRRYTSQHLPNKQPTALHL